MHINFCRAVFFTFRSPIFWVLKRNIHNYSKSHKNGIFIPQLFPKWFYNKKERYFCKHLSKFLVPLTGACAFAQSSSNTNPARTSKKAQKRAYFAGLRFKPLKRHQKNTHKGCFFGAADRTRTGTKFYFRGILSPLRLPVSPQRHMKNVFNYS